MIAYRASTHPLALVARSTYKRKRSGALAEGNSGKWVYEVERNKQTKTKNEGENRKKKGGTRRRSGFGVEKSKRQTPLASTQAGGAYKNSKAVDQNATQASG